MADLSDVTAYLAQAVANAVYPNGTAQPSIAAMDVRIFEGWPIADQLNLDMQGKYVPAGATVPVARPGGPVANVSIFPMMGTGKATYQVLNKTYVIAEPVLGMSFSISGNTITVSGQPNAGEYLTVVADGGHAYSRTGTNTQALLAALAADAVTDYPGTTSDATTLTIPVSHSMVVRQGGAGTMGRTTHRQCQSVMVTVWSPNRSVRNVLASAIDVALKNANKVSMPDTSQATVIYSRTNTIDDQQTTPVYRRDLIYDVDYATVQQFPGYTITSTQTSIISEVDNTTTANAII